MNEKAILTLSLFQLLGILILITSGSLCLGLSNSPVHNISTGRDYASIQEAIDAPETAYGHTILVDAGTYFEHVVVNKQLAILGAGRDLTTIDGRGGGTVVHVVTNDVVVKGLTAKAGVLGIHLDQSNNSVLSDNTVSNISDYYGIYASYSYNCTIENSTVKSNLCPGILVTNSMNFRVAHNLVHNNAGYGINANASSSGIILGNNAFENSFDGIGLGKECRDCTIIGNNVTNNGLYGLWLDTDSVDNLIYDNNIINNGLQARANQRNLWDNGLEGNYWSNYSGIDADRNGIGDAPFLVGETNIDNYPLMGVFYVFSTPIGIDVNLISNSPTTDFNYSERNGTIRMRVLNVSAAQTFGFCRFRIPHALMTEPYSVTVDGASPMHWNYSIHDDEESRWIYFDYEGSEHEVLIQGTPPPDRTPPSITILSPEGRTYNISEIPLTLTINEPVAWIAYNLDGQGNNTISGNTTLSFPSRGSHSLIVYAQDNAENMGASQTVSFTIIAETSEPLPIWVVVAIAAVAVVATVGLAHLGKSRRKQGKVDKL